MEKANVKVLTVYSAYRAGSPRYHTVPRINIEGKWLKKIGFEEGEKIAVRVEEKKLTIVVDQWYHNEKNRRAILNVKKEDIKEGDVIVQYKDSRGVWRKEMLTTTKEGIYYRVSSIPYSVPGIALNDLIEAEKDYGLLFFSRIVQVGGNRVVRLDLRESYAEGQLLKDLKFTGCTWLSRRRQPMTINIPVTAPFDKLMRMFDWGAKSGYWVYQQTRF